MYGKPEGVFSGRKHHKPRLSLDNNTAGVCEREDVNRTREAGNRDEVEGVVASSLKSQRNGDVGFIDWLGPLMLLHKKRWCALAREQLTISKCPIRQLCIRNKHIHSISTLALQGELNRIGLVDLPRWDDANVEANPGSTHLSF